MSFQISGSASPCHKFPERPHQQRSRTHVASLSHGNSETQTLCHLRDTQITQVPQFQNATVFLGKIG